MNTVDANGLTNQDRVEPAATAGTPRNRAEFTPDFADFVAVGVEQFGRERTRADARRISFDYTDNLVDILHADARTDSRLSCNRVRRSNIRVRSEIVVQHGGLSTFEQQGRAVVQLVRQNFPSGNDKRRQKFGDFIQLFQQIVGVDQRLFHSFAQRVVETQQIFDFVRQGFFFEQIADANGATSDFVLISGADTATRRSDFGFSRGFFAHMVQFAVKRQNQSRQFRNFQNIGGYFRPQIGHAFDFVAQSPRINDNAVSDNGQLAAHNARRQQGKLVSHAIHDQSVSCVVSALESHDDIGFFAHQIDDFAFSFIAPLGAYDYDIGHFCFQLLVTADAPRRPNR